MFEPSAPGRKLPLTRPVRNSTRFVLNIPSVTALATAVQRCCCKFNAVAMLLDDAALRERSGAAGYAEARANKGASERVAERLIQLIGDTAQ